MTLLPPFYEENATMKELQSILSGKTNDLSNGLDKTIDQCFINTATDLLSRYEEIHGIQIDVSKSDVFRRERIRAKIRGIGTVTKQMIEDTAASYSNGEVEIIEDNENYRFIVKFVGTLGIPANMEGLTQTLEEIKPAHLDFEFEFTYLTWDDFDSYNKTWDEWDNLNLTWDEFEKYREVI